MRNSFTLTIPEPCHEKWESFNPTTLGGFCSSCQKEVIDFTTWDKDRIESYFKNRSQNTCGRFYTHQLRNYANAEDHSTSFKWLPLSLLSLTLLFSNRHATAQATKNTPVENSETNNGKVLIGDTTGMMTVQGIVKEFANQIPIQGVNVIVKGSTQGIITDENGKFSITILNPQPKDSLSFSFVGLKTETVGIYESEEFSVFMKEDFILLGETVITSYAPTTQKVCITAGLIGVQRSPWENFWWKVKRLFSRD